MTYLALYERSQYWPGERLAAEADLLLRRTVSAAYTEVPFYRELYDRHGVSPKDIKTVADLPKLPAVTKDMLRAAYPVQCTRRTPFRWREYHTGGSTGQPFVVRIDDDTMSRARALMLLRTMWAGWSPGVPTLQTGMSVERGALKWLKDRVLRTTYVSAWDLSDPVLDSYLELIEGRRIEYLTGYATSLYLLARRARAVGFNWPLKGAVSWASNLFPHYRDEIRAAFGCETFDSYGVGEGMQIASQCEAPNGPYHVFCLHVACEVLTNGHPARPGEMGELVLTRLDAGAMPLIRYKVGDVGRGSNRVECPCGRNLPQLEGVDGRLGDIVQTPSGRKLTVEFFFAIFQYTPTQTIEDWQILQSERNAIQVKVVPRAGFVWAHWEALRRQILEHGDPDLEISVEAVTSIPLEASNKRRYVKSTLDL